MALQVLASTSELAFTGTIPSLTATWSISFWYYHDPAIGDGGEYRVIWGNHSGAFVNFAALTITGSLLLLWKYDLFGLGGIGSTSLTAGWHHIYILNVDAQQIGLFVDGQFVTGVDLGSPGTFVDNGAMVFGSFAGDPSFALYDAGATEQAKIEDVKLILGGIQPEPNITMNLKRPLFHSSAGQTGWAPMIAGVPGTEGSVAQDVLGLGDWAITDMLFSDGPPQSYDGSDDDVLIWPAPQILDFTDASIESSERVGSLSFTHRFPFKPIDSEEAFGPLRLAHVLFPGGIGSTEAVGSLAFSHLLALAGIASDEALGGLGLAHVLLPGGVASEEAVGGLALAPAILLPGIASDEAVGSLALAHVLFPGGIPSNEGVGAPTISFFLGVPLVVMTLRARRGEVSSPARIGATIRSRARSGQVQAALQSGPTQLHVLHAGGVVGQAQKI